MYEFLQPLIPGESANVGPIGTVVSFVALY